MKQLALFVKPKARVRVRPKPKPQPISIVIKDDALVDRAYNWEMGFCKRALKKYGEIQKMPTTSTLPIREGNRIVGSQTVYFSTYPDINKRNTIVRTYTTGRVA